MSSLINELLSFTRAEIGSERLEAKIVPLRPIVGSVMDREGGLVLKSLTVWPMTSRYGPLTVSFIAHFQMS